MNGKERTENQIFQNSNLAQLMWPVRRLKITARQQWNPQKVTLQKIQYHRRKKTTPILLGILIFDSIHVSIYLILGPIGDVSLLKTTITQKSPIFRCRVKVVRGAGLEPCTRSEKYAYPTL